jgi:catechol 2,3-dioxygenase-like lactoylglutathione lyase family enzyme
MSLFKKVDAVVVRVPSIEEGLDFYCNELGHILRWKNEDSAAVKLGDSELVLHTKLDPETDLLVESVESAIKELVKNGCKILVEPEDLDVGKVAVVSDPFGNKLTIVDLTKGLYQVDSEGSVVGVE